MQLEPVDPEAELAARRAQHRRSLTVRAAAVLGLLVAAVAVWWFSQPAPDPPERTLFARTIPVWSLDRLNARDERVHRELMLEGAAPWPRLRDRLDALATAYDGPRSDFKTAVAAVNAAAREAGLRYWVDAPFSSGKQWVLTYDELGAQRWGLDGAAGEVESLRVRRLDRVNLEMAFLGHADGDRPVVLVDRVESELLDLLEDVFSTEGRPGEVEEAARGAWRTAMQGVADPTALADAARLVADRRARADRLNAGFGRSLDLDFPARIVFGDAFLESLEPYADVRRPGGPVLAAAQLKSLAEADRALRSGAPRAALDAVLEAMIRETEAHEARHALEPVSDDAPVPPRVLAFAGDDDVPFARSATRELIAYVGQLHDSDRPCATLAQLAFRAAGDRARTTPHHYAAGLLLQALSSAPAEPFNPTRLAGDLLDLCREPVPELRARVAAAHVELLGTPFVPASRR